MNENARILLHPADSLLVPIDPSHVYYLEAVGGESLIRIRRSRPQNLARIRQIRRRKGSLDWELKLQPPVNRILPISRNALTKLKAAFR